MTAVLNPPTDLYTTDPPDLETFAWFCGELTLQQKRKMVLEDWQRVCLRGYFSGVRETVIVIPKKNGKSTLVSPVGLHALITTENADIVLVASSVKQADIIYRHMEGFVRRSPLLSQALDIKTGFKEIRNTRDMGRIRVMASDEDTLDGIEPTLGIIDEYHRHKNPELYGIIRDGLGTRPGQMLTISTAGSDEESPLGRYRQNAYDWPVQKRQGAYRYAMRSDGAAVYHEWALDPHEDITNMAIVKTANPASWKTIKELQELYDSRVSESRWKRFACGIWVMGDEAAIQPEEWDALYEPTAIIPHGAPVWVGLDLGWKQDTTAIVPLWWDADDRRVIGSPIVLDPDDYPGHEVDDRDITKAILKLNHDYKILGVVYDPNAGGQQFGKVTSREHGIEFVEHSQRPSTLALADGRFMEAIRRKEILHNGDRTLRQHVLNAVSKDVSGEQFMFDRAPRGPRKPNDALRAASIAHSVAFAEGGKSKKRMWVL